ncbi:MAG: (d)CMP kinase [Planctomycetota bacterium]
MITIDGPAGSGKSTTARRLADRLGWRYLDTGAMYRLMTCALVRQLLATGRVPSDADDAAREAAVFSLPADDIETLLTPVDCSVEPLPDERRGLRMLLNGRAVDDDELRAPLVGRAIKVVADHPAIRRRLVKLQRFVATLGALVTEGRDQGSVVFPESPLKFFLTASIEERARRRLEDFRHRNHDIDFETVKHDVESRDAADRARPVGALVQPEDATVIDTTGIDPDKVIDLIIEAAEQRLAAVGRSLSDERA